jgi:hypothetical protein
MLLVEDSWFVYDFYVHYLINFVVYSRLTLGEISSSYLQFSFQSCKYRIAQYIEGDHISYLDSVHS